MTTHPNPPALLDDSFPLPLLLPFTRGMATDVGITDRQLHRLTREGYLRRPVRGVYVATQAPDTLELRCQVLALVVPADAFICDRTAAWLHAGDRVLAPGEHRTLPTISCFRPSDAGRLRNPLTSSGERAIRSGDLMVVHGLVVTTPLRTALDLGRLQSSRDLRLGGMDAMLALGVFTLEELVAEVPRFRRQRGVVQLRELAPLTDGGAQSMAESALRGRWIAAGLPRPRTQVPVLMDGGRVFYLDMGLEIVLYAAEYDGEAWHSSEERVAHDAWRREQIRDTHGWIVDVFRKENVFGQHQDAEQRLSTGFREARATVGRRRVLV